MRLLPFILSFLISVYFSTEDHPHRVHNLPGAPKEPSFPLYAGYIEVKIHRTRQHYENSSRHDVFYVLCEAIRSDPLQSPLVVWLNGGPGASSLLGFALEHGPYLLNADGTLRYNDFSWNQYSNVLYIESPDFVGFSRADAPPRFAIDDYTAELNKRFMHAFMTRVHPRYAMRDFFIAGESYGGAYVPYLARNILTNQSVQTDYEAFTNDRFKGIIMGNPMMGSNSKFLASTMQMYGMGWIPYRHSSMILDYWEHYDKYWNHHGYLLDDTLRSNFSYLMSGFDHNSYVYDLHLTCHRNESGEAYHIEQRTQNVECIFRQPTEGYFNRQDVQESLHVISKGNTTIGWKAINHDVFTAYYMAEDTTFIYKDIIHFANDDFRILFYAGNLDLVCPAIHAAREAKRIAKYNGLEEIEDSPKLWSYLGDIGGTRTRYMKPNTSITMDILTFRGSGHMVPINHPSRIFQVINNFLFTNDTQIDYSQKIRRRKLKTKLSNDDIISQLLEN